MHSTPSLFVTPPSTGLSGRARVPGDKSISHRSVMFSAMAEGRSTVRGFLDGGDCRATIGVMRGLGATIERPDPTTLHITGVGGAGFSEPEAPLDCVNSGTTMRLMTGILAGQPFTSFLIGSPQLRKRPMARVVDPLRAMGARIIGRDGGRYSPLGLEGTGSLNAIRYPLPVASAQVKSAVLLGGMRGDGITEVVEPGPARDHTERMLAAMGVTLEIDGARIAITPPTSPLAPIDLTVPGDISSAAFPIVAAAIVPGSSIRLLGVGVNPTRTGILDALEALGASIVRENERMEGGEPVADLVVSHAPLRGAEFGGEIIVRMIDEIPVLAVAAAMAEGRTTIRDAHELRVKETDRIATTVDGLRRLGARIEATDDGLVVDGPATLTGTRVSSHGDHRLAMAMTVAGLVASGETEVEDALCFTDSFPGFDALLDSLGAPLRRGGEA